jgi:hypothetical protein
VKGQMFKDLHKKDKVEGGGKKTKYHEQDGHKSSKFHIGGSGHGGKFREGAKKKKLSYKKVRDLWLRQRSSRKVSGFQGKVPQGRTQKAQQFLQQRPQERRV